MQIEKHTLDNGLTVLLKESRHAPVTTFWVWYRVGSRNEVPGITGIAHYVEHML
ncbi:MAG: insulinase family protein, partial [Anaerolineae bacterium]